MTRLLTLGILFSTAVRAVVVAKLVLLGTTISTTSTNMLVLIFLTSFILALRAVVVVAKLVISGILSSIFLILALYTSFLTTSFFTTSLSFLKSTGTDQHLIYLLYFSNGLN